MRIFKFLITPILIIQPVLGQTGSDWYIFRGDPALNGSTSTNIPDKPKLLWTYHTGDDLRSAPVSGSGRVVAGSMDGFVYCLDINGQLQWKFETGNGIEAAALLYKGVVYVGNLNGTMYCLDLKTGKEKWSYKADNQISGSPNVWNTGERTVIVFGSYDYYLHCLDAGTGRLVWKYETDNFINGTAACYEGRAIFGGCDGFLHVVEIKTGNIEKKIDVATYVASSVAVSKNFAYVGDHDGMFSCVDMNKEKITWTWENDRAHLPFLASPAINQKVAVIGNEDKYTYCFNRSTGDLIWRFNSGSRINASPVIAGNKVLTANMRGDLHLLDINDGNPLWSYELGSAVTGNPAVTKGRFYIAASDGYIYCFGE